MPLFHCTKCHHEWEHVAVREDKCDWCGADGKIIEEKTPMELVDWVKLLERLKEQSIKTGRPIITATQKSRRK